MVLSFYINLSEQKNAEAIIFLKINIDQCVWIATKKPSAFNCNYKYCDEIYLSMKDNGDLSYIAILSTIKSVIYWK